MTDQTTTQTIPDMIQLTAEVIQWGYTVYSESGGMKPDPLDTVRILEDNYLCNNVKLNLTQAQIKLLAKAVRSEFKR